MKAEFLVCLIAASVVLTMGQESAKWVDFKSADGNRSYVHMYDSGGRVYVLQYLLLQSDDGDSHKPLRSKFFDSFKILPRS